jgi:hypothetical protein
MDEGARHMRLVSQPDNGPDPDGQGPRGSGVSTADLDAARDLAEFHRMLAAELAPDSHLRGLVLRCAGHWSRLGSIPRNGLAEAERQARD